LGCDIGDSEEEVFWRQFLRSLKSRGLSGVHLVISDQHSGLVAALRRSFQGASHQRCRVHFARNLLALVPRSHTDMVAAVFRTIFAQPDADAVSATWDEVRDQLTVRFPKIGPLMDTAKTEVLAFTAFPRAHWQKVWSTNPLERINKEIPVLNWCMPQAPRRHCLRSVTVPRSDSRKIPTPPACWRLSCV
jgi:putative transposase